MKNNDVYESLLHGKVIVINYENNRRVLVKFINTGYESIFRKDHILSGKVKDKLAPSRFGIGFIGDGKYKQNSPAGVAWNNMMRRCYSKLSPRDNPTYADCTVCEEWHNFQVFAEWHEQNCIEGYHIDKDVKVDGNRIYGPETCIFLKQSENNVKANAKHYKFTSPDGEDVCAYNLSSFCKENNLQRSSMSKIHSGYLKKHKGWSRCDA